MSSQFTESYQHFRLDRELTCYVQRCRDFWLQSSKSAKTLATEKLLKKRAVRKFHVMPEKNFIL